MISSGDSTRVAVVDVRTLVPDDDETRRIRALIGRPLTRFELHADGTVYFEFGVHGSITVAQKMGVEVTVSRPPQIDPVGQG